MVDIFLLEFFYVKLYSAGLLVYHNFQIKSHHLVQNKTELYIFLFLMLFAWSRVAAVCMEIKSGP